MFTRIGAAAYKAGLGNIVELCKRLGEPQKQLSKEFVRQWLIANNFMGKEGQTIPTMPQDFVETVTQRYIEVYETVTGQAFPKDDSNDIESSIVEALKKLD